MAIRPIVLIGDEVLRQKARRVRDFDARLHTLLDDMRETLDDAEGVGLAAPQVGVSQRVLIVQLPDNEEEYGPQAGVFYNGPDLDWGTSGNQPFLLLQNPPDLVGPVHPSDCGSLRQRMSPPSFLGSSGLSAVPI